jgi:hypothetical protein
MNAYPTVAEVIDKLQALGSANQIAQFLSGEGITGVRTLLNSCPIANYLKRETGAEKVRVNGFWAENEERLTMYRDGTPIPAFIARFDAGLYPELERAGE